MTSEKKLELKRFLIFLALTFAISWIPAIILNKTVGYHEWFETNKYPLMALPFLYAPAAANVLTRKLTHEDWHDSLLRLNLRGNVRYYVIAVVIVSVVSIISNVFTTIVEGHADFSDVGKVYNLRQMTGMTVLVLATSPLIAFNTFGEEFGWRGYMYPKLEKLIGTTGTVIVGGIIWGLWHAVLTVEGHNFGKDYKGYPYLGMLYMCVLCIFFGMILMWLSERSGSIYPAAIAHAMLNNGGRAVGMFFLSGVGEGYDETIGKNMVMEIPTWVICTVFLVLMVRDGRKSIKAKKA